MKKSLIIEYEIKKNLIKRRLEDFKKLPESNYLEEFIFCLLTPQSNAKKCWDAVLELKKQDYNEEKILEILKTRTRFHNNKTRYIKEGLGRWENIKEELNNKQGKKLRNWLADNVKGYGLKEAGHFLRNIGKSENEIAILDRHILRNLKELEIIDTDKIKNKSHYFELESKFLDFSKQINIPVDELDLLFWSKENGEIFK